jgi:hypothetical protein
MVQQPGLAAPSASTSIGAHALGSQVVVPVPLLPARPPAEAPALPLLMLPEGWRPATFVCSEPGLGLVAPAAPVGDRVEAGGAA